MEAEFIEAYKQDHGRDAILFKLQELQGTVEPAEHDLAHLDQWMAPISEHVEAIMTPARNQIVYEPLGVVAIYGTWNVPLAVTLKPMVSAIAAGNCVFIKPSEMSPAIGEVIKKLVEKFMDIEAIAVVNGGPELAKKMNC